MICDMAETYGVLDMQALPVSTLATLASGLRDNSRIKLKMLSMPVSQETLLMALMTDALNTIVWSKTEAAKKGEGKPTSIAAALLGQAESAGDTEAFESPNEFYMRRKELMGEKNEQ